MIRKLSAAALKDRLRALAKAQKEGQGGELAIVDPREAVPFGQGHLFHARSLPLSRLEIMAERLLPRKSVPIVLCDGGEDNNRLACIGGARLFALGYDNLAVLEGGLAAWKSAGFEVFSGVNVPSKAFGEFVERHYGTPHVTAEEVSRRQAAGEKLVILDSRPMEEFRAMSIPGGIDAPGAELVHRIYQAVPDPDCPVVVNCAGRTRSILGAQSLIAAGVPNPVAALKDGTMGWELAGLSLATGKTDTAPLPNPDALAKSQQGVDRLRKRFNIPVLSCDDLELWRRGTDQRSLFLVDVRTPAEYASGHPSGFSSMPGGQLVQATDETIGVLGARVVLYDDQLVRAVMTASWLVQMGWYEVAVYAQRRAATEKASPLGTEPSLPKPHQSVTALELRAMLDSGEPVTVLDVAPSETFEEGHIPGAAWALRGHFDGLRPLLAAFGIIVVTADDPRLIALALPELAPEVPQALLCGLRGGTRAWRDAGLPIESGMTWALADRLDVWEKPYHSESEMRDYLTWEVGLIAQVERDGDGGFRFWSECEAD